MMFPLSNNNFKGTQRATNTYSISLKILIMMYEFTLYSALYQKIRNRILTRGLFFDIKNDVIIKNNFWQHQLRDSHFDILIYIVVSCKNS